MHIASDANKDAVVEPSFSRSTLFQFLDTLADKGLANANTAQSLRVACGKILSDLSPEEEADVRKVNIEVAVRRFHNKNPGVLSPSSLAEYQRRVNLAIRQFVEYQGNPTGYKPIGRNVTKRGENNGERRQKEPRSDRSEQAKGGETPQSPQPSRGLTLEFPLRADFLAQVVVPRDLKSDEARRMCAFVMTLASDYTPQP